MQTHSTSNVYFRWRIHTTFTNHITAKYPSIRTSIPRSHSNAICERWKSAHTRFSSDYTHQKVSFLYIFVFGKLCCFRRLSNKLRCDSFSLSVLQNGTKGICTLVSRRAAAASIKRLLKPQNADARGAQRHFKNDERCASKNGAYARGESGTILRHESSSRQLLYGVFVRVFSSRYCSVSVQLERTRPQACNLRVLRCSNDAHGKRILLYSYGSGLASSLFTMHFDTSTQHQSETLKHMRDVAAAACRRLDERVERTPAQYTQAIARRERQIAHASYKVDANELQLFDGAWYLREFDEKIRRKYARF